MPFQNDVWLLSLSFRHIFSQPTVLFASFASARIRCTMPCSHLLLPLTLILGSNHTGNAILRVCRVGQRSPALRPREYVLLSSFPGKKPSQAHHLDSLATIQPKCILLRLANASIQPQHSEMHDICSNRTRENRRSNTVSKIFIATIRGSASRTRTGLAV